MGKPSEPGVFPGFILFNACKHSALVNIPSHFSFSSRFNDFEEVFPKKRSLIRELSYCFGTINISVKGFAFRQNFFV